LKKGGKAALPTALDGTSPSEFLAHFTSPAGVHRRTAGFPTRPFRSAKCALVTASKIARLRGTSVEGGWFRALRSFFHSVLLSIAEPLHFRSANLPTARGKTTNSNFLEAILDWHFAMIEVK
jgi:hypothetical protein